MAKPPDDLTLKIAGLALSGWTEVRITRRMETCPNDFDATLTERFPNDPSTLIVEPGQPFEAWIGRDKIITGYIDRFSLGMTAAGHTVRLSGRGKTQDLVDCSAEWPGGQFKNCSIVQLAAGLAAPYGIKVSAPEHVGSIVPQFNLTLGQTAWEIIEEVSRYEALLAFEDPTGNLVLAEVATTKAASGFKQGENVLAAQVMFAADGRYSEYDCSLISVLTTGDAGGLNSTYFRATDPGVKRNRKLYMVAEAGQGAADLCEKRALWEAARRAGRGRQVVITADSWRDSGGALWAPNTLAPVSLPTLKIENVTWAIGEVTYLMDEQNGTTAHVSMMDPLAYRPEPLLLLPPFPDVKPPT